MKIGLSLEELKSRPATLEELQNTLVDLIEMANENVKIFNENLENAKARGLVVTSDFMDKMNKPFTI